MKKSNSLTFKLAKFVSLSLKTIVLLIGVNIILTTIFVLIKDQIHDNYHKEKSVLNFKYLG